MGAAARAVVAQKFDLQKNVAVLRDWITAVPSFQFMSADAPLPANLDNRQSVPL
jgi:hypothetical protein